MMKMYRMKEYSLNNLIKEATLMECDHKMKRSFNDHKLAPPIACNTMDLAGHEMNQWIPLSVPSMAAAAYANNQVPVANDGTPNVTPDWVKSATCFKCRGVGHISRSCPTTDPVFPGLLPTPQPSFPRGRGRGTGGGRGNPNWRGGRNNRGQGRGAGNGSSKDGSKTEENQSEVDKPPPKETPP